MTQKEKKLLLILRVKRREAMRNASRQRRRRECGAQVRVRPEFWEQVANDYARQIKSLFKNKNEATRFIWGGARGKN